MGKSSMYHNKILALVLLAFCLCSVITQTVKLSKGDLYIKVSEEKGE